MRLAASVVGLALAACAPPAPDGPVISREARARMIELGASCIRAGETYRSCDHLCWNAPNYHAQGFRRNPTIDGVPLPVSAFEDCIEGARREVQKRGGEVL